jgi:soluble lytic murein transglycosylase
MGLMQVLPATGAGVAKSIGLTGYGGADSLYDPDTNIAIGTAYLRQLMNKYDGLPYVTIAAYNAGPTPTARWQSQRPGLTRTCGSRPSATRKPASTWPACWPSA